MGKWYYMNIGTYMETDDITPDGYYVDANGVWGWKAKYSKEHCKPWPWCGKRMGADRYRMEILNRKMEPILQIAGIRILMASGIT